MKKFIIAISLILSFTGVAFAEERSEQEILNAAKQVLNSNAMQRKTSINNEISILRKDEQLSIVGYRDGRWAFIANDNQFDAVLGYTDEAVVSEIPPALEWWIKAMDASLNMRLSEGKRQTKIMKAGKYSDAIEPLVTTKWNQDAPYNNLCPEYTVNYIKHKYVTGCVATSMAQVMNYHEHPVKGTGSNSYYLYDDKGTRTRVYANFGNTTYDWANMLDVYRTNSYTAEEAKAVATLMYHCGVSVKMQYAQDGSGALSQDACTALAKNFGYHQNIKVYYRDIYHVDEWMDIVYRELNDKCPIIYGGARNDGGHSFVLDGYDATGKVHVNWGWGGQGDGYFDIAKLDGYSQMQDMVIVRKPDDTRYTDRFASTWGLVEPLTASIAITNVTMSASGIFNFNHHNFNGYIGVMIMDLASNKTQLLTKYDEKIVDFPFGYGYSKFNLKFNIGGLADGTYRIYFGTLDDNDTEWQPVRSKEGVCNSYILSMNSGQGSLKSDDSSKWIYDIITGIDEITIPQDGNSNGTRVFDITGKLVYSSKSTSFNINDIPHKGINIIRQTDGTIKKVMMK